MADTTMFFTVMGALSAAVQTLVDHGIKRRSHWLNTSTPNHSAKERTRQSLVHLASFAVACAFVLLMNLKPLDYLGIQRGLITNSLATGLLVSYGGGFFNVAVDAIREFKQAQESGRNGRSAA